MQQYFIRDYCAGVARSAYDLNEDWVRQGIASGIHVQGLVLDVYVQLVVYDTYRDTAHLTKVLPS
jgi:hypothetical protein